METGKNSKLRGRVLSLDRSVLVVGLALKLGGFINCHNKWGRDKRRKNGHQNHNRECLIVQYLQLLHTLTLSVKTIESYINEMYVRNVPFCPSQC